MNYYRTQRRTTAENELNQKCRKRTLSCCCWLNRVSTALIRFDPERYVASTDSACGWVRTDSAGPLTTLVKYLRCSWRSTASTD